MSARIEIDVCIGDKLKLYSYPGRVDAIVTSIDVDNAMFAYLDDKFHYIIINTTKGPQCIQFNNKLVIQPIFYVERTDKVYTSDEPCIRVIYE